MNSSSSPNQILIGGRSAAEGELFMLGSASPSAAVQVPREVPHFPSPKVEESRPASRSVATPKTLLTAGRATVKPVSPRVSPRAKKPQTPGEMQKTRTGLWRI